MFFIPLWPVFTSAGNLLSAEGEHFSDVGITLLCIKHCVTQVMLGPVQLEVSVDEGSAISVDRVDVGYRFFLGYSKRDSVAEGLRCDHSEKRREQDLRDVSQPTQHSMCTIDESTLVAILQDLPVR
jgi:hypothetical protein